MPRPTARKALCLVTFAALSVLSACGGATRGNPAPAKGAATLSGAKLAPRIERVLVAERGIVAMVGRGGCVATVQSVELDRGSSDELRVRCPRPERLASWFSNVDKLTSALAVERVDEAREDDAVTLPAAEIITASGAVMRVTTKADAARLASEVRALAAELAAAELPMPGPSSPAGWQMLRVSGPAHVVFAGSPTRGVLDARVSTTGQYYCEFVSATDEGAMRATKSGWITASTATRAIDEVLRPFEALGDSEVPRATFAVGVSEAGERKASAGSTMAVFKRFAPLQDALGDACLPELDPPSTGATL